MTLKLIGVFMLITAATVYGTREFHCRRNGQACENGGTCIRDSGTTAAAIARDGTCDCTTSEPRAYGYACQQVIAGTVTVDTNGACDTNPAADATSCLAVDAQCLVSDAQGATCLCNANRRGPLCKENLVSVTQCDATQMTISIELAPAGGSGEGGQTVASQVLLLNLAGQPDESCPLSLVGSVYSRTLIFSQTPEAAGADPCNALFTNVAATPTVFQYSVIVAFRAGSFNGLELQYDFTCDETSTQVSTSIGAEYTGNVQQGGEIVNTYTPATLSVLSRAGNSLDANIVAVGDALLLRIAIDAPVGNTNIYNDLIPDECSVFDSDPATLVDADLALKIAAGEGITFISQSCPVALDISGGLLRIPLTLGTVDIEFDALKFQTTDNLFFRCTVTLCNSESATDTCTIPTDCTTLIGRRRKRSLEEVQEDNKGNVTGRVIVLPPNHSYWQQGTTPSESISISCLQSTVFIVVTAVLGLLMLFAVTVAITVCLRWSRQQRTQPANKDNL